MAGGDSTPCYTTRRAPSPPGEHPDRFHRKHAVAEAGSLKTSIKVDPLTCAIGAELSNVELGAASRDPAMVAEIRALLLKYRVLFLRDQDFTRAEHVAFARHFGSLEDHPVVGSDPDHPGLVRIYKGADTRHLQYENAWHCDATWRECPPMGAVLRCVECPPVGGDIIWVNMVEAYARPPGGHQDPHCAPCAPATASRPVSAP